MFEKITDNVEIHQTLPDAPNMTTQELKITWDKGCKIIKEAFNNLIDKLNKMGIEGTVLYENSVGSIEEITLNDSVAKYDRVKIFYHYNNIYGSTEVDNPNEKTVSLNVMFSIPIYNLARAEYKNIKISGNQITNEGYGYLSINTSGTSGVSIEENKIYITKVIGYKEGSNE